MPGSTLSYQGFFMLSIGRFLNSQLATDGVEHLTSTAQSLQRIATNCWCPLCHFTHFTAHFFWGVALSTIPFAAWHSVRGVYAGSALKILTPCNFITDSIRVVLLYQLPLDSESPWVHWFAQTLRLHIANLRQLTLRGPEYCAQYRPHAQTPVEEETHITTSPLSRTLILQ